MAAAQIAARKIKKRLTKFASENWNVPENLITYRDDRVFIGNESIGFGELTKKAYQARVSMSASGFYKTPKLHWDRDKAKGRPFFYFAYGAACSEVAIDILSGEMKVRRVDILHDVGRSINPAIDIGQIEGAFVQGMGWLTTEELVYDDKGRLLTHAPSTYKIPVASDVPKDFRVALFAGSNREDTIYHSKAVGEPPLMLGISVFAAIADAVHSVNPGKPVALDAPATPEAILRAVGPVDAVAAFAPLPADWSPAEAGRMIGGQFQLWTEYIKDARTLDYMTFPRACAFAEVAWSGKPSLWSSSGSGLRGRVEAQLRRLDAAGVEYRPLAGPHPWQSA